MKNEEVFINFSEDNFFLVLVFKIIVDFFVGKILFFRVIIGEVKDDMIVLNFNKNKNERFLYIFFL